MLWVALGTYAFCESNECILNTMLDECSFLGGVQAKIKPAAMYVGK